MQMTKPDWMSESDRKAFDRILLIWSETEQVPERDGALPQRVPIIEGYGAKDSEQKESASDFEIGSAAWACIKSLEPYQAATIRRRVGLMTHAGYTHVVVVMRYPRLDYIEALMSAELALLPKFKANTVTSNVWHF